MLSNDLKKKAQVREVALAGVVMLALCIMAFSVLISPKKKAAVELEEKLGKVEQEVKAVDDFIKALVLKQNEERKHSAVEVKQQASSNPRVQMIQGVKEPDYKDISDFLQAVTRPEFRMSLDIQSLNYNDPKKEKGFLSTRFSMIAKGQFGTMVDFIGKLEEVSALVSIDKINIDVDKNDARMVILELVGSFYKLEG